MCRPVERVHVVLMMSARVSRLQPQLVAEGDRATITTSTAEANLGVHQMRHATVGTHFHGHKTIVGLRHQNCVACADHGEGGSGADRCA